MAGTANAVEVAIRVRSETAGGFENFGRDVATATRTLRVFGGVIASEINPILGTLLTTMGQAGREVRGFGLTLTALGVGAAAAVVGLTAYISNATEATRKSNELRYAVESLNFGGVVGQATAAAKALRDFDQGLVGTVLSATRTPGALNLLDKLFGREGLERVLQEAREGFARVLPLEQIRITTQEYAKQQQALQAIRQVEADRMAEFDQLTAYLNVQQSIEQSLSNQFAAEEKLLRIEKLRRDAEANARPGGAFPGELELSAARLDQEITTLARRANAAFDAASERARAG